MLNSVYAVRCTASFIILFLVSSLSYFNTAYAEIQFNHDEVDRAWSGIRIGLKSGVSEDDTTNKDIKIVRAYFKADSETRWHFVPMRNGGGGKHYSGLLPAPDVHTKKVNYRLLAVNGGNQTAKTEIFTIDINQDEEALARLQRKSPTDIKIDVSEIQEIYDQYSELESHNRITETDRLSEAKNSTEPSPDSRVEVRSEYQPDVITVSGFQDYIDLYFTGPAEAFGVSAGIVDSAASIAGVSGAAATTEIVGAAGGGSWLMPTLGGVILAGGVAGGVIAASDSDSSSSSSDDSGSGGPGPGDSGSGSGGSVSNFEGTWDGPSCGSGEEDAPRYRVSLTQSGSAVNGRISFHACPKGGRVTYQVSGTATSSATLELTGNKISSRGTLGDNTPSSQNFTVTKNGPPNPRLDL